MADGVLLDTSFLITLADPGRRHHAVARRYWRYFIDRGIVMMVPTLVLAEFCIKQEMPSELLRHCVVLPFNWDDALRAASLDFSRSKGASASRDALKDDVKVVAQALVRALAWIITDDGKSFYRFAAEHREAGLTPIKLADGFDESYFTGGQTGLNFEDPETGS